MKIVVLAGGISTERDVSLISGTQIYRALKAKGHQVVLLDLFMGLEQETGDLSDIFEWNRDWSANIGGITEKDPDISKIKAMRRISLPTCSALMCWMCAGWRISFSWGFMAATARMAGSRQPLT